MKLLLPLLALCLTLSLHAQDRQFTRVEQSATLPENGKELEVFSTHRFGRDRYYHCHQVSLEYEFGITDRLLTSLYINFDQRSRGEQNGIQTSTKYAVASEWKYRLSDPVGDPFGSALYGEVGVGSAEMKLEFKLILDKKIGPHIFAMNLYGEAEYEFTTMNYVTESKVKYPLNILAGYMYRLSPHWYVGVEVAQRNTIYKGEIIKSVVNAGPTLIHAGKDWSLLLNVLPQISNLKATALDFQELDVREAERMDLRLIYIMAL